MTAQPDQRAVLLDSLRGWAALSVLCFHLFSAKVLPAFPGGDTLFYAQADRAAVLVFFVLSGYVIGLTNRKPWSAGAARDYGWRRVVRLYPIYLLAVLLGWVATTSVELRTVAGHLFFLQDSDPTNPLAVPNMEGNSPLWSLHYEAFYYLCFLVWWRWPATVLPSLAGVFIAAPVATAWAPLPSVLITHSIGMVFWLTGLVLSRLPPAVQPAGEGAILAHVLWLHSVYHFAPAYLLQAGLGIPSAHKAYLPVHDLVFLPGAAAAVALAGARRLPAHRLWHLAAVGLAAAGLAMILYAGKNPLQPRWAVAIAYLLAGILLFRWRSRLGFARLAAIGAFSYALYVVHMPVLALVSRFFPTRVGLAGGLAAVGVSLAVILPLAWWLESRLQPRLRARLLPVARA